MIGIFDSGIGGLTVARALMTHLPDYDIAYFGDTARTPYGTKSPETVTQYAIEDAQILVDKGAKLLVVGCNTASSVATDRLRKDFDIPIFEVISPAIDAVLNHPKSRRVGIIGTRATVSSGVYQGKLKAARPELQVFAAPCPLLVPLVEEGWLNKAETRRIIKKYLHPLKVKQIDTLILGCTHYPLVKDIIQVKIGKRVKVIDSSEATAGAVKQFLDTNTQTARTLTQKGTRDFFVSDITDHMQKLASTILKRETELQHIRL